MTSREAVKHRELNTVTARETGRQKERESDRQYDKKIVRGRRKEKIRQVV